MQNNVYIYVYTSAYIILNQDSPDQAPPCKGVALRNCACYDVTCVLSELIAFESLSALNTHGMIKQDAYDLILPFTGIECILHATISTCMHVQVGTAKIFGIASPSFEHAMFGVSEKQLVG